MSACPPKEAFVRSLLRTPRFPADSDHGGDALARQGFPSFGYRRGHAVFTPFASALGPPAISMPCRVEPGNLPVGMQIGAASNRDLPLLAFARAYEVRLFDHHWPT